MREHVRSFLYFGVLGLATTIGIAWLIAAFSAVDRLAESNRSISLLEEPFPHYWSVITRHSLGRTVALSRRWSTPAAGRVTASGAEDVAPKWGRVRYHGVDAKISPIGEHFRLDQAAGWPMLALWGSMDMRSSPGGNLQKTTAKAAIPLVVPANEPLKARFLPLAPLPVGMAIDVLFFDLAWYACVSAIRFSMRRVRQARGLCCRCGYDIRGEMALGCPECGWRRT